MRLFILTFTCLIVNLFDFTQHVEAASAPHERPKERTNIALTNAEAFARLSQTIESKPALAYLNGSPTAESTYGISIMSEVVAALLTDEDIMLDESIFREHHYARASHRDPRPDAVFLEEEADLYDLEAFDQAIRETIYDFETRYHLVLKKINQDLQRVEQKKRKAHEAFVPAYAVVKATRCDGEYVHQSCIKEFWKKNPDKNRQCIFCDKQLHTFKTKKHKPSKPPKGGYLKFVGEERLGKSCAICMEPFQFKNPKAVATDPVEPSAASANPDSHADVDPNPRPSKRPRI